jgi:RNA polymerase sigma-70 factor (ECF subfamily)
VRDPAPHEADLLRRARNGDEAAFASIVDAEHARARAVAWRLTRDPTSADEIVQDAFVRLHRALPEFRQDSRIATWLYRTIVNLSHDRARASARRLNTLSLEEAAADMPTTEAGPDTEAEAAERTRVVDVAVAALPAPMRDVVVLRYVRGLGYDEFAEVLGCPPGTVASRIHRALRAIGALLATQGIREGSL